MYKPTEFLMIEDNPADVRLVQEFFKGHKFLNQLTIVNNETEALRLLRRQDEFAQASLPDVVLLSISLLWNDGSLLQEVQANAGLRSIPIVVMIASEDEKTTLQDHSIIRHCVTKPLDFQDILSMMHHINDLWIGIYSSAESA